jgi:hypothetical protein
LGPAEGRRGDRGGEEGGEIEEGRKTKREAGVEIEEGR